MGGAGAGWWGVRHLGLEGLEILAELLEGVELLAQFFHLVTVHGAECAEHHQRGLLKLVEELLLHLFELVERQGEQRRREFTLIRDAVRKETFAAWPGALQTELTRLVASSRDSDVGWARRATGPIMLPGDDPILPLAGREVLKKTRIVTPPICSSSRSSSRAARMFEALTVTPSRPRLTTQTPAAVRNKLQ